MGDIVILDTSGQRYHRRAYALWQAYGRARDKAEKSQDLADGIAAGKAWAAFLKVFESTKP